MIRFGDLPRRDELSLQHRVRSTLLVGIKSVAEVDFYDTELGKWAVYRSAIGAKRVSGLIAGRVTRLSSLDKYILEPSRKWHLSSEGIPFRIIHYYLGKRYVYGVSRHNSRLLTAAGNEASIDDLCVADIVAAYTMPGCNSVEEVGDVEAVNRYTKFYKDVYNLDIGKKKLVDDAEARQIRRLNGLMEDLQA